MIYLASLGLNEKQIGLLFTLTLVGDTVISLWLTTAADRTGRRRMLIAGSLLMVFAVVLFSVTENYLLLLVAATVGVISPSGYEVGPFLSIEQAALSHVVPNERRTQVFAWYNLLGSFATALGSLFGGGLTQSLQELGVTPSGSYRVVIICYAAGGVILGILFTRLSHRIEVSLRPGSSG